MIRTLAERIMLFAAAATVVALLRVYGKLSFESSIVLGGLFTLIGMWVWTLKWLVSRPAYRITVTINNEALCAAIGVVGSSTETHQSVEFVCTSPGVFVKELYGHFSSGVSFKENVPVKRLMSPIDDDHQGLEIELVRGSTYEFLAKLSYPLFVNPNRTPLRELPLSTSQGAFVLGRLPMEYFPEPEINTFSKLEFGAMFSSRGNRKRRIGALGWNITEEGNHVWNEYLGVTYSRL